MSTNAIRARRPPGRPRAESAESASTKRDTILRAAMELLRVRDYDAVSLDAIVARAACSKSAIYEHFGNKEGLLAALTRDIALAISSALHAFHLQHLPVDETLRRYARLALELILADQHIAVVRAIITASQKHPELGPQYYEVGAGTARRALARYFADQTAAGALAVPDPAQAAHEFQGLLFWEHMVAQLVGAVPPPTPAEMDALANATVDRFIRLYGARREK